MIVRFFIFHFVIFSALGEDKSLYKLNIGDRLQVAIYGQENSMREVQVDPYGNITYLYVGTVKAYGKTIPKLTEELNDRLKKEIKFSVLTVSPVNFGGRYFFIGGSVNKPGRKPLKTGMKLLSALASGGGMRQTVLNTITVDQADLKHAFILRNGKNLRIDFLNLMEKGDMSQNISLESGDYIYIPDAVDKKVYVLGEVRFQRSIDLMRPMTLLQAITKARGVSDDASDELFILRGSLSNPAVKKISFSDLINGKEKDFFLKKDDIVYVPERKTLFGEQLIELALRAFIARIAAESGSRTLREVFPNAQDGDNGLDFDISP